MLVPSMTVSEVLKELLKDYETLERKICVEGQLLHTEMRRKGLQHQAVSASFKSASYNQWNLVYFLGVAEIKTFAYVKAPDQTGMTVYSFLFDRDEVPEKQIFLVKYYKHFFDRYNERMGLGYKEISKTIKHFFKKNTDYVIGTTPEIENGLSACHIVFPEGTGISWKSEPEKTYHLKTFISKEMYNRNQQRFADDIREKEEAPILVKLAHLRKVS